jgi:hypothetical protein
MSSTTSEPGDAARRALAEALGTTDFEIVAERSARLPSGEEIRLFHAAVPGQHNHTGSVAVDASGAAHPPRRFEALAGRGLFEREPGSPEPGPAERRVTGPATPITIDPAANDLTLRECDILRETVTVNVPESPERKADVYLLADTTGSMGSIIGAVQAGLVTVLNDPAFTTPGFDVFWGVGNYKDFPIPDSSPYAFQHQLSPTNDLTAVQLAVNAWSASGGVDTPEAQLFALQEVATNPAIGWRPESKRILVWIGDAPGHDPVCAAISGAAADVTEASATAALQAPPGITVVAISTDTGVPDALNGDPTSGSSDYGVCTVAGTPGQADRITAATGGAHTLGVNAGSIVSTLVSLISAAVHTIGRLELRPAGAITPFVVSIVPAGYDSLPGDVPHTLRFEVTWRGVQACADSDQVFTGSLVVDADGAIVASKPVRITVPACRWHHSVEMICGTEKPGGGHDDDHDDDHDDRGPDRCQTVVDGRYATAVTIYNPTNCPVRLVKYFAPLILHGDPVGREPRTIPARPFARLVLGPGEATLEDCCTLEEAVGPTGGPLVLGVLDIVADHPLEVTVTHTAHGAGSAATSIDARTITPRRA